MPNSHSKQWSGVIAILDKADSGVNNIYNNNDNNNDNDNNNNNNNNK